MLKQYHAEKNPTDDVFLFHAADSLYQPQDPTYITNYNNARSMICKIDRDELLQDLVRCYLFEKE